MPNVKIKKHLSKQDKEFNAFKQAAYERFDQQDKELNEFKQTAYERFDHQDKEIAGIKEILKLILSKLSQ